MEGFELNDGTLYTIDDKGVSVINKNREEGLFIQYPEAAVWLILVQEYNHQKSLKLLVAILNENEEYCVSLINKCLLLWREMGLLKQHG
jgi:hypothetical protein